MPTFYLHLCNGSGFTEDRSGQDFPDLESARQSAIAGMRDLMAEELRNGEINLASYVDIEDAQRRRVTTVPFTDAVNIVSNACPPRKLHES